MSETERNVEPEAPADRPLAAQPSTPETTVARPRPNRAVHFRITASIYCRDCGALIPRLAEYFDRYQQAGP